MTHKQKLNEVGMVAAIIGDAVMQPLYAEMQKRGTGYMSTVEEVSKWALEFVNKHEKTKWEDVLEEGTLKTLSNTIPSIICWDDAVFDFAHYKLNEFIKD